MGAPQMDNSRSLGVGAPNRTNSTGSAPSFGDAWFDPFLDLQLNSLGRLEYPPVFPNFAGPSGSVGGVHGQNTTERKQPCPTREVSKMTPRVAS